MVARVQAPGQRGQFENGNFTISDKDFIFNYYKSSKIPQFVDILLMYFQYIMPLLRH